MFDWNYSKTFLTKTDVFIEALLRAILLLKSGDVYVPLQPHVGELRWIPCIQMAALTEEDHCRKLQ